MGAAAWLESFFSLSARTLLRFMPIDQAPVDATPPLGPPAVRAFVQDLQEHAYRQIAHALGLDSPATAYAYLSPGEMPADNIDPEKLRQKLGDTSRHSAEEWRVFDTAVATYYRRYFSLTPPTPYEEPNWFRSMSMTLGTLRESLDGKEQLPDPAPFLSSLPSGDVNAKIVIEPSTKAPVIFFEHGLFRFFYHFSQVAFAAMPPISGKLMVGSAPFNELPDHFQLSYELENYLYNSVCNYVIEGSPRVPNDMASSFQTPAYNLMLVGLLVQEMELFVMAHEIAHYTRGHLAHLPRDQEEAWRREYEADEVALAMVTKHAHISGLSWAIAAWAADTVFGVFHLLGSAVATMAYGKGELKWVCPTHPAPLRRQRRLRGGLATSVQRFSWHELQIMNALCEVTQGLRNALWGKFLPGLLDQYLKGGRPSQVWKERSQIDFVP